MWKKPDATCRTVISHHARGSTKLKHVAVADLQAWSRTWDLPNTNMGRTKHWVSRQWHLSTLVNWLTYISVALRMLIALEGYSPLFCLRPLAEDRRLVLEFPERHQFLNRTFSFTRYSMPFTCKKHLQYSHRYLTHASNMATLSVPLLRWFPARAYSEHMHCSRRTQCLHTVSGHWNLLDHAFSFWLGRGCISVILWFGLWWKTLFDGLSFIGRPYSCAEKKRVNRLSVSNGVLCRVKKRTAFYLIYEWLKWREISRLRSS
jgi:hypothetical protein